MEIYDQHIVKGLKNGEEKYFKMVFDSSYDKLFFFTKEFVKDDDTAHQLTQGAFVKLWEKRIGLKDHSNLLAWLFTVVKNDCLKWMKKSSLLEPLPLDGQFARDTGNAVNVLALQQLDTSDLSIREINHIINETLNQLPPRCREVFQLSRFEELKNREIAAQLHISEKAVEAHISKALKIFRVNLSEYLPLVSWLFI
ncbi:MAG: RNA polymerase sigma-70 factor [Marinilabiliaceae bacterium]|nr:RNA polymerase sigma-70 factor [Marinilabiliaceae bacterium]